MKSTTFCKSLLAVAVAAASLQAQAASLRLSGDQAYLLEDQSSRGSLAISGRYYGYGEAVGLYSVDLQSNLNNNARIYSYGLGDDVAALYIGESALEGTTYSSIGGHVRNNQELIADGEGGSWAVALGIAGADVYKGVHNKGLLEAWSDGYAAGLAIGDSDWNYSWIGRDVSNKGEIYAAGDEAYGIDIYGDSVIDGSLRNRRHGLIQVMGRQASGISLAYSGLYGDLENDGVILVDASEDGYGIDVYDMSLVDGDLQNRKHGYIRVLGGHSATGINLQDSELSGGLSNEGEILASAGEYAAGIDLINMLAFEDLHNEGGIYSAAAEAWGIVLDASSVDASLVNDGLIEVDGDAGAAIGVLGSRLIRLENRGDLVGWHGAYGIDVSGSEMGELVNSGSIYSDSIGIYLDNASEVLLTHSGSIEGGDYAIYSNGPASMLWVGGSHYGARHKHDEDKHHGHGYGHRHHATPSIIRGNIYGLTDILVSGNVNYQGAGLADHYDIELAEGGELAVVDGHLALASSTGTSIAGDLYVGYGSSLGLTLGSDTTEAPLLDLYGTAVFDYGSLIRLRANGHDFTAAGSTYTLVQADSIEDYGLNLLSSSALLQIDSYSVDATTISATVTTRSEDDIDDLLWEHGASHRGRWALLHLLPALEYLAEEDESNDLLTLLASVDADELAGLVEQLYGDTNYGMRRAALNSHHLVGKLTGKRLGQLRRGMSSGDVFTEHGLWAQALYSKGDQDSSSGLPGFTAYSRGFAVGADGKLSDAVTLGLAWSYLDSDVSGAAKTEVDGHALTLYSGYDAGAWYLDGSMTFGLNDNSSKRYTLGDTARSDYDSKVFGIDLMAGYRMDGGAGLVVEPRAGARYTRVISDSYREKGATTALQVSEQNFEAVELGAGLAASTAYAFAAGVLQPKASLMVYHDFAADRGDSTSRFLLGGSPFVTEGAQVDRTSVEAGIGLDYSNGAVTYGVGYEYLEKGDFSADSIQARVRYEF